MSEFENYLNDYHTLRLSSLPAYKEQRDGQLAMNVLANVNKSLYNEITGTEFDPFYNTERLTNFFSEVRERMEIDNGL